MEIFPDIFPLYQSLFSFIKNILFRPFWIFWYAFRRKKKLRALRTGPHLIVFLTPYLIQHSWHLFKLLLKISFYSPINQFYDKAKKYNNIHTYVFVLLNTYINISIFIDQWWNIYNIQWLGASFHRKIPEFFGGI